ncbi:multidrug effflux MFS transporter [Leptospira idonii]|uniref:Bcr/CflA family efflux MFS transporter n=1 Tax=Leptospira idonii TaxID=1193500 RepID=A0A4R9M1Q7_9LEPT|nr:multidrug effflux MFS transporter [Leptospira idonii]TGN19199.1 Bcr/CflA family efflux MFS transporter [Leptospira idonii]
MRNLSNKQETWLILLLGTLTALAPLSIDMYLPSFPAIAKYFGINISGVELSLTFFFAGISLGQLIYGPILDRFGRKKPLLIGLSLYAIASVGCFFAPNIHTFILLRLLQGLGGCVGMVAANTVVRDVFPSDRTAKVFSLLMLTMGIAPMIAPTLGGLLTSWFGWHSIFLVLSVFGLLLFVSVSFFLPETTQADTSVLLKPSVIFGKYIFVLKDLTFLRYALTGSFASAGMFAYLAGSPFVMIDLFGFTEKEYGIMFAVNVTGLLLGSQVSRILLSRFESDRILFVATSFLFGTGGLLILSHFLISLSPFFLLVPIYTYLFCMGNITPNSNGMALSHFTKNIGSASAFMGFMQMAVGSTASAVVGIFHSETALPMTAVVGICAFLSFSSYHGLGRLISQKQKQTEILIQ